MTVRVWMPSGKYPNKHVGIYFKATTARYEKLKFIEGQPIELDHEIKFTFDESRLDQLGKLGCLWTNINPPLVNGIIGDVLSELAGTEVQLFRAYVAAKDGETRDYYLVNVTRSVHCLDYEKSIIDSFWDDGRSRSITKLRFKDDGCLQDCSIARLKEYLPTILVSEGIYRALSKLKYKGLYFEFDSDSDGRRF